MAQVTETALIVAHGSPSDPEPQENVLRALAASVGHHLPDWDIKGVTLAKKGALEGTIGNVHSPLVYPFFMADGWFTNTNLPSRLTKAGCTDARRLPPFGTEATLIDIVTKAAKDGLVQNNLAEEDTTLLLAAHGSGICKNSSNTAKDMTEHLRKTTYFRDIVVGFVEEAPYLADVAKSLDQAICLPFFCLRAGHVIEDIPEAMHEAAFEGPILPPLGEHELVPPMIARTLVRLSRGKPS